MSHRSKSRSKSKAKRSNESIIPIKTTRLSSTGFCIIEFTIPTYSQHLAQESEDLPLGWHQLWPGRSGPGHSGDS